MKYRRFRHPGATYFFTVVTQDRKKILCVPKNIELLRHSFEKVMNRPPFVMEAAVVLPDHLHCIWRLPEDDWDFSMRWNQVKGLFTKKLAPSCKNDPGPSKRAKREQAVWQRRFWEHKIRDQEDYNHHVEYIHYNPVKHGLVKRPADWPHSSFHRFVKRGWLPKDWAQGQALIFDDATGFE